MPSNLNLVPLSIFDNFRTDWLIQPVSERKFSRPPNGAAFPGEISQLTAFENQSLLRQIFDLVHISIRQDSFTARIRRTGPGDFTKSFIHHDFGDVAGVIYLSRLPCGENPLDHGTTFYEHKETGWRSLPDTPKARLLASFIVNTETTQLEKWKTIGKIPFAQNRMLIYSGKNFHSGPTCQIDGTCSWERVTLDFFGYVE